MTENPESPKPRQASLIDYVKLLLSPRPLPVVESDQEKAHRLAEVRSRLTLSEADQATQYFELYKLMVASSEALVARRQTVNTYFLTVNGLLATVAGLLLQRGDEATLTSLSLAILCIVGLVISVVWRLILISFGQLNRGKFAVINQMEQQLTAAIYDAEWQALGQGGNPTLYRSFTEREALVPAALLALWFTAGIILALITAISARG